MAKLSVEDHERRIQGVFRRAWVDNGWSAAVDETPLDVLLAEEFAADRLDDEQAAGAHYWPSDDAPESERIELNNIKAAEAAEVAAWARRQMVMWILGGGLHPFCIVQRFYALLYSRYQEFIGPLNETWLAEILNQGRAAFSAVVKRLFTKPIKIKTGITMLSPGMKSAKSKAGYAANAAKNRPRGKVDSTSLDDGAEAAAERQRREQQIAHLKALRDSAERKRIAALTGCSPDEIDLDKSNPHPHAYHDHLDDEE